MEKFPGTIWIDTISVFVGLIKPMPESTNKTHFHLFKVYEETAFVMGMDPSSRDVIAVIVHLGHDEGVSMIDGWILPADPANMDAGQHLHRRSEYRIE